MSKKKLEVIELNKKKEEIILEERQNPLIIFFRKHRLLILLTLLSLSLIVFILGITQYNKNINNKSNDTSKIEEVLVDTTLTDLLKEININNNALIESTAKNKFNRNNLFKNDGEVLLVKTVEADKYIIKFYSDGMAIKKLKGQGTITKILPLSNGEYGISSDGIINSEAKVTNLIIKETKTYPWGTVTYYQDGSAEISDSKMDMFVRNSNDVFEKYISNNKVSYVKETKNIGQNKINYYYDGTIEVTISGKNYLVRNEKDIKINGDNITFPNNNSSEIIKTTKLSDGLIIDYYQDGGAIIRNGTKSLSVRKSNSIIIKNNKLYEIVDNIYVTVSNTLNNGDIVYYTNGSAIVNINGNVKYIEENSNIKYENNQISQIDGKSEKLIQTSKSDDLQAKLFETTAVIENKDYIMIIPKDRIILDKNGDISMIDSESVEDSTIKFTISNNTDNKIKYRVVIEKSNRTNLDVQYMRYQISSKNKYIEPKELSKSIWKDDRLSKELNVSGTNYILLEDELVAHDITDIKLMLWTDYETIPNSMQDKYFYGTIKVYSWTEE